MSNKLALNWYDKEKIIKVEPRILVEDTKLSNIKYDSKTENMLIHGDNLLALKALEHKYAGRIKCIYIDPPYNIGKAFEEYDDNLEHSIWLSLMRARLELLKVLLSEDGSLWISIDDDEGHYLKVLCDEIFGRHNFVNTCIWQKKHTRSNDAKWFSDNHDFILVYAKNKDVWRPNLLPRTGGEGYSNVDNDPRGVWSSGPCHAKTPNQKDIYPITTPSGRVVWPPAGTSWRFSEEKMKELIEDNHIYFGKDGNNVPRYKRFLYEVKDGFVPLTLWLRDEVGDNQEAKSEVKHINPKVVFPTPKPERLIQHILTLATNENDIVLDSFLGSGTTVAVAHKMSRRYIGIEMENTAYTHCKVRLDKVIDGTDNNGLTTGKTAYEFENSDINSNEFTPDEAMTLLKLLRKASKVSNIDESAFKDLKKELKVNKVSSPVWKGGGGYRFFELAQSLINVDCFGEYVINKDYNPEMLAAAVALHEGFTYGPDETQFWKQSKGNENSYLFVTTRHLSIGYVDAIKDSMQNDEYLIIACRSFDADLSKRYKNILIKKIPQMLLNNCEFGKTDYNLNVIKAPAYEGDAEDCSYDEI